MRARQPPAPSGSGLGQSGGGSPAQFCQLIRQCAAVSATQRKGALNGNPGRRDRCTSVSNRMKVICRHRGRYCSHPANSRPSVRPPMSTA